MAVEYINLVMKYIMILIVIILGYRTLNNAITSFAGVFHEKNIIDANNKIVTLKYNEEDTVKHLDNIINDAIDEYELMNFTVKDVTYISNAEEEKMITELKESIPSRISDTLISQLSIIYNDTYIPEMIGKYIYMKISAYILDFNTKNRDPKK